MTEEKVNGEVQNDGSDTQNVKTVENAQDLDVTGENSVVEEQIITNFDKDEKILSDMLESGKTEVTTNELITAGFDTSRMASYSFQIRSFKLSRLLLISPFSIEKMQS
jgi:hypothetical protein